MPSSLANADGLNDFEDDGFEFSSSFSSKIDDGRFAAAAV